MEKTALENCLVSYLKSENKEIQRFETLGEKRDLNFPNHGDSAYIYPIINMRMIYSERYAYLEMLPAICNSRSVSSYVGAQIYTTNKLIKQL